jgi:hypothetical protein
MQYAFGGPGKVDCERLHARVPTPFRKRLVERVPAKSRVLLDEASRLHDFERVRRSHQHLAEQAVGIKRYGGEQGVALSSLCGNDTSAAGVVVGATTKSANTRALSKNAKATLGQNDTES